jgi:hypothetical protein
VDLGLDTSATIDSMFNAQTFSPSQRIIESGNVIENVQFVPSSDITAAAATGGTVRFTVWSATPIPVGDELPIMSIGSVQCDGAYVDGSTQRMTFECPAEGLSRADGEQIIVRGNARTIWKFGRYTR